MGVVRQVAVWLIGIVGFLSALIGLLQWWLVPSFPVVDNLYLNPCGLAGAAPQFVAHLEQQPGRELYYFRWMMIVGEDVMDDDCDEAESRFQIEVAIDKSGASYTTFPADSDDPRGRFESRLILELPEVAMDSVHTDCDCDDGDWLGVEGVGLAWSDLNEMSGDGSILHVRMMSLDDPDLNARFQCTMRKLGVGPLVSWFICLPGGDTVASLIPTHLREWRAKDDFSEYWTPTSQEVN